MPKLLNLDLRMLEYFRATARERNMTRAAEEVGVSQPSITVAIRRLEKALGAALIDRSHKELGLTPEGELFLRAVEPALDAIHEAANEIREYKELKKGEVRLGMPPLLWHGFLLPLLVKFCAAYPQLKLLLYEGYPHDIINRIADGALDLGVVVQEGLPPALDAMRIAECRIAACIDESHPMAKRKSLRYEDLEDQPLIMPKDGAATRRVFLAGMKENAVEPNIVFESTQLGTMKGLARCGAGIAIILATAEQKEQGLKIIPLEEKPLNLSFVWSKGRNLSKAARTFLTFCRERKNKK